jgi:hypothetical protein
MQQPFVIAASGKAAAGKGGAHRCPPAQLTALYASITDFEMRPRSLTW